VRDTLRVLRTGIHSFEDRPWVVSMLDVRPVLG
jgi:hypothetical protein